MDQITFDISPPVTNQQLNGLFAAAWEHHTPRDFQRILQHSLLYVGAHDHEQLVGFVNVAWDGGVHAFLLDTTVHPDYRRRGLGRVLVQTATAAVRQHDLDWLHVDFEPTLRHFYEMCGFQSTEAGLIQLRLASV